MSKKKYVPQGVYLACDKGTTPTEFKITNNSNSFLFDEPVATNGDIAPNVNILPFGSCSVKNGSPCMPVPTAWQGFEDGIFIGNFAPLLEDSVMPCGVGGKIEIFYSLEEAQAACAEDSGGFWSTLGKVALVVAAVALIVVTGGAAIAAVGAIGAASGALATGVAIASAALEVAGVAITVKALYDYSQDGDEEALFKVADDVVEDLPVLQFSRSKMPNIADNIDEAIEAGHPTVLTREAAEDAIKANRRAALKGTPKAKKGQSLDEYPFASSKEGGAGANVKSVPVKEQSIQGGTMSSFYQKNNIQDGDKFIVEIID